MLLRIPVEYKRQFKRRPNRALMSIAGFAVRSGEYYLKDLSPLAVWSKRPSPIVNGQLADWFVGKDVFSYFIHVDLSIRRDKCGFAMGHGEGQKAVIDLGFSLSAEIKGEVDVNEVIDLIVSLQSNRGFGIREVSFDQFQSSFVMQTLRKYGMRTSYISVDKDSTAYDCWRDFLYRNEFDIYDIPLYRKEAKHLVYVNRKVDHPKNGSKDLTDAVAAVCKQISIHNRGTVELTGVVVEG